MVLTFQFNKISDSLSFSRLCRYMSLAGYCGLKVLQVPFYYSSCNPTKLVQHGNELALEDFVYLCTNVGFVVLALQFSVIWQALFKP